MATLIRALIKGYHRVNVELADPRTQDWFLMSSPWPVLALIFFYIYFVQSLGIRLMKDRPPFKLDRIMQIYDVLQIISSAYLLYRVIHMINHLFQYYDDGNMNNALLTENPRHRRVRRALSLAWLWDYNLVCEPVDYSNTPKAIEIARTVWMYFCLKIIDLLDTVFFVLRKKNSQISFLHVYHHSGMVFGTWCGVKYLPGGHGTFLGVINSFVHVIMYAHYLATSMKISRPWWKKYVTQLQLIQFFLILVHFLQLLWAEDCGFPRWPALIFVPQNLFMIVLFGDFYYNAYIKKPKSKTVEQNGVSKDSNHALKSQ